VCLNKAARINQTSQSQNGFQISGCESHYSFASANSFMHFSLDYTHPFAPSLIRATALYAYTASLRRDLSSTVVKFNVTPVHASELGLFSTLFTSLINVTPVHTFEPRVMIDHIFYSMSQHITL